MNTVVVRIPTPLRSYTKGADEVHATGATVAEVMSALGAMHQGLLQEFLVAEEDPYALF